MELHLAAGRAVASPFPSSRLSIALLILLQVLNSSPAQAQRVAATLWLGPIPYPAVVNPVTNKVYVPLHESNELVVIDGATNALTRVPVGARPRAVAVNPVTNKIYVAHEGGPTLAGRVTVFDGESNASTTFPVTGGAYEVAVNSVTNKIYIIAGGGYPDTILVMDGNDNSMTPVHVPEITGSIAVNPETNRIYVGRNDGLAVIDGATNATTVIPAGYVSGLAVNPVTNRIYTTDILRNVLTVIDGATNAMASIAVDQFPGEVVVNPVTNKIYVAASRTVTVIDGNNHHTTSFPTGGMAPNRLAVNPVTNTIYVVDPLYCYITLIDGSDNSLTKIPAGFMPTAAAVNPITNKTYVVNGGDSTVTVIDGATDRLSTFAPPVGGSIGINVATNKLYITNQSLYITNQSQSLFVVDANTNTFETITMNGVLPDQMAINEVTNKVYLTDANGLRMIILDGSTNEVTTLPSGTFPGGVALNPVTNRVYFSNGGDNDVTVLDGYTNQTFRVRTGNGPSTIAVNPVTNKIYVANQSSSSVTVIDGGSNMTTDIPTTIHPCRVVVNPVTNKIYVGSCGWSYVLTIIDGNTNSTVTMFGGLSPWDLAINPITNKIYVPDHGYSNVLEIDGNTNSQSVIPLAGAYPGKIAVNQATNKIYVAHDYDNLISVIDGSTNRVKTLPVTIPALDIVANPITGQIFAVPGALRITEQRSASIPLVATITPVPARTVATQNASFSFTAASTFAPIAPTPNQVYYQVDTWQGPWAKATSSGGGNFNGRLGTVTQGPHILYAYATDGHDATVSSFQSSPLTSNIVGYPFLAVTTAPPTITKAFGTSSVATGGTTSLTFTITNSNPVPLTGVGFSDAFPAGLQVAGPSVTGSCGAGTIVAAAGSTSVSLSGGTLGASSSCTFSVNVVPIGLGTIQNTTGPITSNESGPGATSNTATLSVRVTPILPPQLQLAAAAGTYGSAVLSAVVLSSRIAIGRVTFSEGGSALGSAQVSFGAATLAVPTLSAGVHTITATYSGDIVNGSATSAPTPVTVAPAALTITANDATRGTDRANPALSGTISGIQNNDTIPVTYTTKATTTCAPGQYAIVPAVGATSAAMSDGEATTAALSNYTVNAVNGTLTVTTAGWWTDPKLNGSALYIEYGGKSKQGMDVGGFAYDANGNSTWMVSNGRLNGSLYSGDWHKMSGGQTLTGPYKTPTQQTLGAFTLLFSDSTHAAMIRTDGTQVNLQRFSFTGSPPSEPVAGAPQSGWWWGGASLSGTGYGIEIQGSSVFIVAYVYDDGGNPVWYLATGSLTSPSSYSGTWDLYAGGPQLTSPEGNYSASKVPGKSVAMSLTFSDATHGTLTMGSVTIPIVRFQEF